MNDINLVPIHYKQSFKRKWYIAGGIIGGMLVVMGLVYFAYLPVQQINSAKKEQIELDAKLSSEALAEVRTIIGELGVAQTEKSDVERNLQELDTPSHVSRKTMDIIVANAPEALRINQITIDRVSNITNITGSAEKITNVAQYMAGLNNTDQFQDITYTTSKNSDDHLKWEIEYTLQIQMKPFQETITEEVADQVLDVEESEDSGGEGDL